MAYAFVQDKVLTSGFYSGATNLVLSTNVTADNTLLIFIQTLAAASLALSDSNFDSFSFIGSVADSSNNTIAIYEVASAVGGAGSTTITITPTGADFYRAYAAEYSGVGALINYSGNWQNGEGSGANTVVSGNINVTTAGGLIWGVSYSVNQTSLVTAGTSPISFTGETTGDWYLPEDGTTPGTGNQQATWGIGGTNSSQLSIAAAFAPPAASSATIAWLT